MARRQPCVKHCVTSLVQVRAQAAAVRGKASHTAGRDAHAPGLGLGHHAWPTPKGQTLTDTMTGPADVQPADTAPEGGARKRRGSGLDSMVLPELKQLAGSLGLKGTGAMRKGQLIAAIQSAQGGSSNGGGSHGASSNGGHSNGGHSNGGSANGGSANGGSGRI